MPSRVIATSISLVAFAAALLAGISVGNELTPILLRSLMVMFVTYCVGAMIGTVAQIAIDEHIAEYKKRHPLEKTPVASASIQPTESLADTIDEPALKEDDEEVSQLGSIADHQPSDVLDGTPEAVAA